MPADDRKAEMTRDGGYRDDAGEEIAASSIGEPASGRLDAFLNELRSLAAGAPPAPSNELEAMLEGGAEPQAPTRRPRRHRKTIAGAVIMGSIGAGLSGAAAAEERPPGPAPHVHAHLVPEAAPAHDDPLGGPARTRVPSLPEPQPSKLEPAPAVPRVAPTPPAKPQRTNSPPADASSPVPSEDRERDSHDAEHGQPSEPETPEHEHGTESDEPTPPASDRPSERT
jgi:hypothetical protein